MLYKQIMGKSKPHSLRTINPSRYVLEFENNLHLVIFTDHGLNVEYNSTRSNAPKCEVDYLTIDLEIILRSLWPMNSHLKKELLQPGLALEFSLRDGSK